MSSARRLGGGSGVDGACGELEANGLEPNGLLVEEQAASITAADEKTAAGSKWRVRRIAAAKHPRGRRKNGRREQMAHAKHRRLLPTGNLFRRIRHRFAAGHGASS